MSHFGLELYERNGSSRRRAMVAEDYEEMLDKLAAKSGFAADDDLLPDLEAMLDE